jgi:DnaJ family protein C protein 25
MVVLLLTILANYFSWWAQKQKWQRVANRLIQATVEDWTPSQGGTPESKLLRQQALEQLAKQTANEDEQQQQGKKVIKLTAREKKAKDVEALRPIVEALVHEMKDFGAGFHQPTWKDLLSVRMMHWPIYLSQALWWQSKYLIRRLQQKELNDDERTVLTQRAVGPVAWELAGEEERESIVKRELWITQNLADYKEEQEIKSLSKAEQKMYAKMKKKGSSSFLKED